MPERTVSVGSASGLHARPAALFVAAAAALPVPVTIRTAEKKAVPAKSMLSVLSLGAKHGTEVTLAAEGAGAGGTDAPHAIDGAFAEHRAAFEAAGGYLAERVADLDDLRDRAVAHCLGLGMPGLPSPGRPYVLLARDLAPADTALLDPAEV